MTGLSMIPNDAMAIGIGAFCGAMARHHCGRVAAEWIARDPQKWGKVQGWHTAMINIGGSFILGGVAGTPLASTTTKGIGSKPGLAKPLTVRAASPLTGFALTPRTKLLVGVGFCGSFTTFSTYSVDVVNWLSQGQAQKALSYIAVNNVGGIAAAAVGMMLMKKILG
jgi:fluoride exporter